MDNQSIARSRWYECSLSTEQRRRVERTILKDCKNGKIDQYEEEKHGIIKSLKTRGLLRCGINLDYKTNCNETLKTTEEGIAVIEKLMAF